MTFNFLKNLTFKEDLSKSAKTPGSKTPGGLSLRVYSSGRVYPSAALTEKFKLEYGVEGECGIDFFQSKDWSLYPSNVPPVVFIAFVPRTEPKIDIFGMRRATNTSVLTQGPVCEELWNALIETYKLSVPEDTKYVDIYVLEQYPVRTEDGIYMVPKIISKGVNKGTPAYQRRENITLYPLSLTTSDDPADVVQEDILENVK